MEQKLKQTSANIDEHMIHKYNSKIALLGKSKRTATNELLEDFLKNPIDIEQKKDSPYDVLCGFAIPEKTWIKMSEYLLGQARKGKYVSKQDVLFHVIKKFTYS